MKMNKKGITLVEVIVVLIIMAVLAGILVASYTGYIDKANQDAGLVEARAAYLAATTVYHELYAQNPTAANASAVNAKSTEILDLAGLANTNAVTVDEITNNQITKMTYTNDKFVYTLEDKVWTVAEVPAP